MPQLTFQISEETHKTLTLIPYGSRKRIYRLMIENLARLIEENRVETIAMLVMHELTLKEAMGKADE